MNKREGDKGKTKVMCSCSYTIGSKSDVIDGMVGIPLNGVRNNDFYTSLAMAWCQNPDKVKAAFKAQAGLDIDADDFPTLAKGHTSGNDVKVYKVDFMQLIRGINFTQAERDNASCKIILTQ